MFAVYLALGALINIPNALSIGMNSFLSLGKGSSTSEILMSVLMSVVLIGLSFFFPWLFWKKSDYLMLKVFGDKDFFINEKGESEADSAGDNNIKFSFSSDEVLALGLTLLGCWFVSISIFPSLAFIFNILSSDVRDFFHSGKDQYKLLKEVSESLGSLIIGVILIRKTEYIVAGINKLRK